MDIQKDAKVAATRQLDCRTDEIILSDAVPGLLKPWGRHWKDGEPANETTID